jgi:hypothetical protein
MYCRSSTQNVRTAKFVPQIKATKRRRPRDAQRLSSISSFCSATFSAAVGVEAGGVPSLSTNEKGSKYAPFFVGSGESRSESFCSLSLSTSGRRIICRCCLQTALDVGLVTKDCEPTVRAAITRRVAVTERQHIFRLETRSTQESLSTLWWYRSVVLEQLMEDLTLSLNRVVLLMECFLRRWI